MKSSGEKCFGDQMVLKGLVKIVSVTKKNPEDAN
jgi:hypothetical protein